MSLPRSVAEVIRNHVTLQVEGIDRMYLNVYQPKLQSEKQAACFFRSRALPPSRQPRLARLPTCTVATSPSSDQAPKGRDEDGRCQYWVRRHDEYAALPSDKT